MHIDANAPPPLVSLKAFLRRYRVLLVFVLFAAVITVPSLIYYELGLNSVNGTHPELVTASKAANSFQADFYVTIHVWSWAGSLDTQVYQPAFTLTVDNLPFGTQNGASGTFQPNNFITFTLDFSAPNSGVAQAIANSNTNYLVVQMSADVSAGWYRALLTKWDSHTWTFA